VWHVVNHEAGREGVTWFHLAHDGDKWRALVSKVMNFRLARHKMRRMSSPAEALAAFKEGLCSMALGNFVYSSVGFRSC
jgi:hypothetical protein